MHGCGMAISFEVREPYDPYRSETTSSANPNYWHEERLRDEFYADTPGRFPHKESRGCLRVANDAGFLPEFL